MRIRSKFPQPVFLPYGGLYEESGAWLDPEQETRDLPALRFANELVQADLKRGRIEIVLDDEDRQLLGLTVSEVKAAEAPTLPVEPMKAPVIPAPVAAAPGAEAPPKPKVKAKKNTPIEVPPPMPEVTSPASAAFQAGASLSALQTENNILERQAKAEKIGEATKGLV